MSELIQLPCPQCGQRLELDPGFAGGVARCSRCAALLAVPTDPASQKPTVLRRDAEPQDDQVIPIARRAAPAKARPIVRAMTALAFVSVLLVVVGGFVGAIVFIASTPTEAQRESAAVSHMRAVMEGDPYRLERFNALGVALQRRAVVIVDADYRSEPWLEQVNAALLHGLTRPDGAGPVNLIYTADPLPMMLGSAMVDPTLLDADTIDALMQRIEVDGTPSVSEAVRLALQFEPRQIVLVIGRPLPSDDLAQIRAALDGVRPTPRLDAVTVDKDDPDLDALATQTGGMYVPISQRLIGEWSPPQ